MNVEFDRSFIKYLQKIKDVSLLKKIDATIFHLERTNSIKNIKGCQKLSGFKNYYRIRIGNYRLGFETINSNTIRLIIIAHRKNIYEKFP